MINIIRAELFRVLKSKQYRGCIIASIIVVVFTLIIDSFSYANIEMLSFNNSDGERVGFNITVGSSDTFESLINNAMGTGLLISIIGVVLVTKINVGNIKSGIYKNTVSYGYERWKIYLGNLISIIIGISIIVVSTFFTVLIATVFIKDNLGFSNDNIYLILKAVISYLVMVAVIVSMYSVISLILESSSITMFVFILDIYCTTVFTPIISKELSGFVPYVMFRTLASEVGVNYYGSYILNGIVILIIMISIGCFIFNKREFK